MFEANGTVCVCGTKALLALFYFVAIQHSLFKFFSY